MLAETTGKTPGAVTSYFPHVSTRQYSTALCAVYFRFESDVLTFRMLRERFIIYNSSVNQNFGFSTVAGCQLTDLILVVEKYREGGIKALWKCLGHGSEVSDVKTQRAEICLW